MKITRLKRGYRISLNDSEFEAISLLVEMGQQDAESAPRLSARAQRVIDEGRFREITAMRIDEDRRRP